MFVQEQQELNHVLHKQAQGWLILLIFSPKSAGVALKQIYPV